MFAIISSFFLIWVIFLGGADRIENTLVGYFEFGIFADKSSLIKFVAWIWLISDVVVLLL